MGVDVICDRHSTSVIFDTVSWRTIAYSHDTYRDIHNRYGGGGRISNTGKTVHGFIRHHRYVRVLRLLHYWRYLNEFTYNICNILLGSYSQDPKDFMIGHPDAIDNQDSIGGFTVLMYCGTVRNFRLSASIVTTDGRKFDVFKDFRTACAITNYETYTSQFGIARDAGQVSALSKLTAPVVALLDGKPTECTLELYGEGVYKNSDTSFGKEAKYLIYAVLRFLIFRDHFVPFAIPDAQLPEHIVKLVKTGKDIVPGLRLFDQYLIRTYNNVPVGLYNLSTDNKEDPGEICKFIHRSVPQFVPLIVDVDEYPKKVRIIDLRGESPTPHDIIISG